MKQIILKFFEKRISAFAIFYAIGGLVFAFVYALYYHWPVFGYFSPGFFAVALTWPFQAIGLLKDLFYYGISGPPTPGSI